jgi:hypothetical protein
LRGETSSVRERIDQAIPAAPARAGIPALGAPGGRCRGAGQGTGCARSDAERTRAYSASEVLRAAGQDWFVLAGANSADHVDAAAAGSPYPDGTLRVYRWTVSGWSEQATVRGWMGPIFGCSGITPVFLTGSHDPDFAAESSGAADTNWLSVVSERGGHWHLVRFDYGYTSTSRKRRACRGRGVHGSGCLRLCRWADDVAV